MSKEIKIITLGDIFDNIESEEKAFRFKDYIKRFTRKSRTISVRNRTAPNRTEH